jgi:hypothetical protein
MHDALVSLLPCACQRGSEILLCKHNLSVGGGREVVVEPGGVQWRPMVEVRVRVCWG